MENLPAAGAPKTEIEKLRDELHLMKTAGIIEVAIRNPNVASYMSHWEGRAIKAETALALSPTPAVPGDVVEALRAENKRLRDRLESCERYCVPISTDGRSVFIDGHGDVPLDFDRITEAAPLPTGNVGEAVAWQAKAKNPGETFSTEWFQIEPWTFGANPNVFEYRPLYAAPPKPVADTGAVALSDDDLAKWIEDFGANVVWSSDPEHHFIIEITPSDLRDALAAASQRSQP